MPVVLVEALMPFWCYEDILFAVSEGSRFLATTEGSEEVFASFLMYPRYEVPAGFDLTLLRVTVSCPEASLDFCLLLSVEVSPSDEGSCLVCVHTEGPVRHRPFWRLARRVCLEECPPLVLLCCGTSCFGLEVLAGHPTIIQHCLLSE